MIKAVLLPLILFGCFTGVNAQSLLIATDTVFLYDCDPRPDVVGITRMYNETDTFIYVKWHIEKYDLPHNGIYALIIAGHQYIPFEDGHQFIFTEDSSEIIFYMWNDTLLPGDTSLVQIRIWDDMDSVNTSTLLTALQVCPLATGIWPDLPPVDFNVFPNPADDVAYMQCSDERTNRICIHNAVGTQMADIQFTESVVRIDTRIWPPGIYMVTAFQDWQPLVHKSILITR
jgi:hypothetical protein